VRVLSSPTLKIYQLPHFVCPVCGTPYREEAEAANCLSSHIIDGIELHAGLYNKASGIPSYIYVEYTDADGVKNLASYYLSSQSTKLDKTLHIIRYEDIRTSLNPLKEKTDS